MRVSILPAGLESAFCQRSYAAESRKWPRMATRTRNSAQKNGLCRSQGVLRLGRPIVLAGLAVAVLASDGHEARAQQAQQPTQGASGADWQTGTQVERKAGTPKGAVPGWSAPGNVTVVPRSPAEPKAPVTGEIALTAVLTDDGTPIEQGMVWRAFQAAAPAAAGSKEAKDAQSAQAKTKLVGSWREAAPTLRLPPGDYLINASFGRAHLTRKISIAAGAQMKEQFVLNAGGLRVKTVLANGEQIPPNAISFDVYAGDADGANAGSRVIGQAKPGLIVRLNAGVYKVVSTYGDGNSVVRADVTIDAGKLSEATIAHHSAKVTLKLVARPGGEAIADTTWTIQSAQNELVRESMGALPSHILAAGSYVAIAKNAGKTYRREFTVEAGDPIQVEVVIK